MNLAPFDTIQGQESALQEIRQRIINGSLHGSFLFTGISGIGKKMTALAIAQSYDCRSPDLIMIAPDQQGKIKIEVIRQLLGQLSLAPVASTKKIVIIDEADRLTRQSANALLKSLEEPSETTLFILISSTPGRLLGTIRSRCQQIRFQPLSVTLLTKLLSSDHTIKSQQSAQTIQAAAGSLTQAKALGEWIEQSGLDPINLLQAMATQPLYQIQDHLKELPDQTTGIHMLLNSLRSIGRDLLLLANCPQTKEDLLFLNNSESLKKSFPFITEAMIYEFLGLIDSAEKAHCFHTPALLIWETLATQLNHLAATQQKKNDATT